MTGEFLGRLCTGGGWTYGALWCNDCGDSRLLVLEEIYHEDQSVKIFEKVISQVHVIGQGIIGEVAISGKHRWINFCTICMESSEISSSVNPDIFEANAEWQDQILAGIKTIAVIPLPSLGVLQFGSTQKILENSDFIAEARHLLQQHRIKRHGWLHVDMNFSHPQTQFDSATSYSSFKRYGNSYKQRQGNHFSSECSSSLPSSLCLLQMPVSTSSVPYAGHGNLFHCTPCFSGSSNQLMTNRQAASTKARLLLPTSVESNMRDQYIDVTSSKCPSKVFPFNPEISTFSLNHSNTKSTNHQIHDVVMNNPIHSCQKTNDQLSDELSAPMYSLPESHDGFDRNIVESDAARNQQLVSDHDMFDGMEFDLVPMVSRHECWDDMVFPVVGNGCTNFSAGLSDTISELEMSSVADSAGKGLFSDSSSFEQLLEAVVAGNAKIPNGCDSIGTMNSVICHEPRRLISNTVKQGDAQISIVSSSQCDMEKTMQGSLSEAQPNCRAHTWIDDSCSIHAVGSTPHHSKKPEESGKPVRKRARQGESTRPRPKDRQQIQDRIKELREIVPNGAKCSIDSLLDRTIKHMLFLQNVEKYADKLKQDNEGKLIGEESGVVLKDNTNGGVGGATWAYEVARQTMVCPILVEDVHPSGQMLVEMLCEEQGFFLEIADVVRGFGLTILKGDMEIRERKIWARFLVEVIEQILLSFHHIGCIFPSKKMISLLLQANRDVTRMDIFLSLVQLLQHASSFRANELQTRAIFAGLNSLTACQQQSIPIGLADKLH